MRNVVLVCLLATAVAAGAAAQGVPALVNYQGRLTNASGGPITGDHALVFSIWDDPMLGTLEVPAGHLVWGPQTLTGVQVSLQGNFNVVLGPQDASARPLLGAFSGDRFIQISVDSGGPILPRQQILTAPFAANGNPAGTLLAFAGTTVPPGYLACDGSPVSRTQYSALFSALSTTWGAGDGATTFNLPDLRGRFLMGAGLAAVVGGIGGVASNQIPAHQHALRVAGGISSMRESGGAGIINHDTGGPTTINSYTDQKGAETLENRPPYAGVLYVVKY